jgi:hypothetical protein
VPRASFLAPCDACNSCYLRLAPPARTRTAHSRGPWTMGDLHAVASRSMPMSSSASTNLYRQQQVDEHTLQHMFHAFQMYVVFFYLDVAKVDLVLHILQCLYIYVACVCFKCFSSFQTYVASGLSGYCICYPCYLHTLQMYVFKYFSCFKHMLQVFYLNVAYVVLAIHVSCKCMFSNVSAISNVCCKCFI